MIWEIRIYIYLENERKPEAWKFVKKANRGFLMSATIPRRRIESILLDIQALNRTQASSLEISFDLTTNMMELFIEHFQEDFPNLSDSELLAKLREILFPR